MSIILTTITAVILTVVGLISMASASIQRSQQYKYALAGVVIPTADKIKRHTR